MSDLTDISVNFGQVCGVTSTGAVKCSGPGQPMRDLGVSVAKKVMVGNDSEGWVGLYHAGDVAILTDAGTVEVGWDWFRPEYHRVAPGIGDATDIGFAELDRNENGGLCAVVTGRHVKCTVALEDPHQVL